MKSFKDKIDTEKIPEHVAVIMDGNGRWAAKNRVPRIRGHEHGVEAVRSIVEGAGEIGIKYLTLYAFSTENWKRPKNEVNALMDLLVHAIENETEELMKNNVRLGTIGDLERLPVKVTDRLQKCIRRLDGNTGLYLILALSYSSKWEITQATRQMALEVKDGTLDPEDIDEKLFEKYLSTSHLPHPEILIRTSGEFRISNFLLWQIAYSELYFSPKLWPDFRKEDLFEAINDFQKRERRFGKISEQLFS